MEGLAPAAALLAALATACPGTASTQNRPARNSQARPRPAVSLCRAPETVLFTCAVRTKTVSVCGKGQSGAVYRFGRPGHIELEATDLHFAYTGFSGGGEEQILGRVVN